MPKKGIADIRAVARVTYLDELTEEIILCGYAALRKRGNSDRTINNKHTSLFGFLRWAGVYNKKLAARASKYTDKAVEVYGPKQLRIVFASLKESYDRIVFETVLKTSFRSRLRFLIGACSPCTQISASSQSWLGGGRIRYPPKTLLQLSTGMETAAHFPSIHTCPGQVMGIVAAN